MSLHGQAPDSRAPGTNCLLWKQMQSLGSTDKLQDAQVARITGRLHLQPRRLTQQRWALCTGAQLRTLHCS